MVPADISNTSGNVAGCSVVPDKPPIQGIAKNDKLDPNQSVP